MRDPWWVAIETQLARGSLLAGFQIDGLLGRGGMGVVYRATQLSLERQVALKLINPEFAHEERFRERFLREARLAASLEHTHLLPVYEAGEAGGTLFLAMRLVEGASLGEILGREGRLSSERALRIFSQLCRALQAAHAAGLLHRDVKPHNVLLAGEAEREHAYLCDFGLSRRLAAGGSLTVEGSFVGTAAYVAPEQIRGEEVDGRADLYPLACLLYECLTGQPPFIAEDELALCWAHLHEPAPTASIYGAELARFDAFFAIALAKDRAQRFSTAGELAQAARSALEARTPAAPSPPLAPLPPLPRRLTSFVGRERELRELLELVLEEDLRLLTLTGPGGTGKTRLALRAAEEAAAAFPDGVHWVGLASLRDPALVTDTIAQTVAANDGLAEHIAEKRLLLVLDNFEQVVEAAPELSALLAACPQLSLLVTSRELLRLQGEREFPVPALAEPEAIALFCERSRLEPTDEIGELCARLDHLPLAVELAAARTTALSPKQILERLSERLDLLKGGRDADPRQRTLRSTIEWSYELLLPEEQRLFRTLSVFAGGCTLEAAEEVCGADLDTLQSLVEKSLLRFTDERYWMLETIRQHAWEQLGSGRAGPLKARHAQSESNAARIRHAQWHATLAQSLHADLLRGERHAVARLERELDNLRVALEWTTDAGEAMLASALLSAVWPFFINRALLAEGVHWAARVRAIIGDLAPRERITGLQAVSELLRFHGELREARLVKHEALVILRQLDEDDPATARAIAHVLYELAGLAIEERELDTAAGLVAEALALRLQFGDRESVAQAMTTAATVDFRRGELARAREAFRAAAASVEDDGVSSTLAGAVLMSGECSRRLGDLDAAARELHRSLTLFRDIAERFTYVEILDEIAGLVVQHDDLELAATLLAAAERHGLELEIPTWDLDDRERTRVRSKSGLGEAAFDEAYRRGSQLSLEDALDLALEHLLHEDARLSRWSTQGSRPDESDEGHPPALESGAS